MARLTLPDGRRKAFYARTRQEAAQKLVRAQKAISDGLSLAGERQTTGNFLSTWLRDHAGPRVRPMTFRRYQEIVRLHIIPELGRVPLSRLTPQNVEKMLTVVAAKESSSRSAGHCRAVLRNALQVAMKHNLVQRNVAALADTPPVSPREVQVLTAYDARRILEAVKGDPLEALFTISLALGLRQSEALGLRWGDINVDVGTLSIQRTLQKLNRVFAFYPPKSARSRRTNPMPAPVAKALHRHMRRQLQERIALGAAWEGERWGGLVFTNEVGNPLTGHHVSGRFYKLIRAAGLPPMRYHDLRHGAASLMAAHGVPARVAMEILGHAHISTTLNLYTHITSELQRKAAERVAEALWPEFENGLVSELVSNQPQTVELDGI